VAGANSCSPLEACGTWGGRLPDQPQTPLEGSLPLSAGVNTNMSSETIILRIGIASCGIEHAVYKAGLDVSFRHIANDVISHVKDLNSSLDIEALSKPEILEE
jgi:hypothetical protein